MTTLLVSGGSSVLRNFLFIDQLLTISSLFHADDNITNNMLYSEAIQGQWQANTGSTPRSTLQQVSLTFRNARSIENGIVDEILSNRETVHGFDDFGQFQWNSSKRNQLGGFSDLKNFRDRLHFWTNASIA